MGYLFELMCTLFKVALQRQQDGISNALYVEAFGCQVVLPVAIVLSSFACERSSFAPPHLLAVYNWLLALFICGIGALLLTKSQKQKMVVFDRLTGLIYDATARRPYRRLRATFLLCLTSGGQKVCLLWPS